MYFEHACHVPMHLNVTVNGGSSSSKLQLVSSESPKDVSETWSIESSNNVSDTWSTESSNDISEIWSIESSDDTSQRHDHLRWSTISFASNDISVMWSFGCKSSQIHSQITITPRELTDQLWHSAWTRPPLNAEKNVKNLKCMCVIYKKHNTTTMERLIFTFTTVTSFRSNSQGYTIDATRL